MSISSLHCSKTSPLALDIIIPHCSSMRIQILVPKHHTIKVTKLVDNEGQSFFHKNSNTCYHSKSKMSFERKVKEPHELVVFENLEPLAIITKWNKKDDDDANCANVDEITNGANDKLKKSDNLTNLARLVYIFFLYIVMSIPLS
jgi:hypothetical protein